MVTTRTGAKRMRSDDTSTAPNNNKRKVRAPTVTLLDESTTKSQRRALSVVPNRPINIQEIHIVTKLYVLQAFDLRGVTEQIHRNSTALMQRNVVRRLQNLTESFQREAQNNVDERFIRKTNRIMQEALDYIVYYMKLEKKECDDIEKEIYLDVFTAALETLLALLQASEHFRQTLFTDSCWELLLELIRRHDVKLRNPVCHVLSSCFVDCRDKQLSASDWNWNKKCMERITQDDSLSALFHENMDQWGSKATRFTTRLVTLYFATIRRTPHATERHFQLALNVLIPLTERCMAHSDNILAQMLEIDRLMDLVLDEKERIMLECDRLQDLCTQIIASPSRFDEAFRAKFFQDWKDLKARQEDLMSRTNEARARMDLLR
jgi:hypothetical protein